METGGVSRLISRFEQASAPPPDVGVKKTNAKAIQRTPPNTQATVKSSEARKSINPQQAAKNGMQSHHAKPLNQPSGKLSEMLAGNNASLPRVKTSLQEYRKLAREEAAAQNTTQPSDLKGEMSALKELANSPKVKAGNLSEFSQKTKQLSGQLAEKMFHAGTPEERNQLTQMASDFSSTLKDHPKLKKEVDLELKVAKGLVDTFSKNELKSTLSESVSSLCQSHGLSQADITREANLIGSDDKTAMLKMTNRAIAYKKGSLGGQTPSLAQRMDITGYEFSVVKGVDRAFRDFSAGKSTEVNKPVGTFNAVLSTGKVIVEEKYLGAGAFKAATLASDFFAVKNPSDRNQFVTLKPKELVKIGGDKAEAAPQARPIPVKPQAPIEEENNSGTFVSKGSGTFVSKDDSGTFVSNDDSGTVVSKEDSGTFVSNDDSGTFVSNDDSGTVVSKEDSGTFVSNNDSGTFVSNDDDSGTFVSKEDSGTFVSNNDSGTFVSNEVAKGPAKALDKAAVAAKQEANKNLFLQSAKSKEAEVKVLSPNDKNLTLSQMKQLVSDLSKTPGQEKTVGDLKARMQSREKEMALFDAFADLESTPEDDYNYEIAITQKLQGPGVVKMHSVVNLSSGDRIMIQEAAGMKMPAVPGLRDQETKLIDLKQMRKAYGKGQLTNTDKAKMLDIYSEGFKGILGMHAKGFIHRDLKEENILITPDGHGALADFGSVVETKNDARKGAYIGTPHYSAPETFKHDNAETWNLIDEKCDVWSCGIIVQNSFISSASDHPAVNGKSPLSLFESSKTLDEREHIYNANYPEPENKQSFEHLIWSSTRINPEERPSMEEFCKRFDEIVELTKKKLQD